MSKNSNLEDNEIDLSELFAALWYHKLLITLCTSLSILLTGYLVLNTEKKFTATAIFKINQKGDSSGFNLPGEIGALVSLSALSSVGASSSTNLLLERAKGREFIIDMKTNNVSIANNYEEK